jgi:general stress protein 26
MYILMRLFFLSFSTIILLGCNQSSNPVKKNLKEIAKEIMVDAKNCALITIDSLGIAHARAMDPFAPEEDFTVWMATNPKSLKVQQIQKNSNVTLYYFDTKSIGYVTLQGEAKIVDSQKEKEMYWKTAWENFYENRTTDYMLIKFTPIKANVISEKYSILGASMTWGAPELKFNN